MADVFSHPPMSQLNDYLLGRLDDAAAEIVERHLAECAECSGSVQQLEPRDALVELLTAAARVTVVHSMPIAGTMATLNSCQIATSICGDAPEAAEIRVPAATQSTEPIPPQLVGHSRYRVIRMLGRGGMGCVWLAEHLVLGRPVALKMLRGDWTQKDSTVERFDREIRAAAKLCHPNIATVHDAEQIGDSHFLVMEYVEGETLADIISAGPMPLLDACRAIRDAAYGLAHAHAARLIHRDVKPGNMMRTPSGRVKILDFGLVVSPAEASMLTGPNLVMGTPDYIAPEQAEDPHSADERSDIYSLGCTFFHLLTAQVPFPVASIVKKIDAHQQQPVGVPDSLPQPVLAVLHRMVQKAPDDRFQSAADVATALEPFCAGIQMPSAVPKATGRRKDDSRTSTASRRDVGRHRLMVALLALIFAAFIFLIVNDRGALKPRTADNDLSVTDREDSQIVSINEYSTPDNPPPARSSHGGVPLHSDFQHCLKGHTAVCRSVLFSPDSRQLYSASDDGTVRVWDVHTGALLGILDHRDAGHEPVRIFGLATVDDGSTLISSQDDRLRIWNVASFREQLPGFAAVTPDTLTFIDASSDETLVAAGSFSGAIRVWNVADRQLVFESKSPEDSPTFSVKWIPEQTEILSDDGTSVVLVNTTTGERRSLDNRNEGYVNVAVSADGKVLAAVLWNSEVSLCDRVSERMIASFVSDGRRVRFLPDGRLVTSGTGRITDIWNADGSVQLVTFYGGNAEGAPLAVSPDGNWIATGGANHSILIWAVPESSTTGP